MYNYEAYPVIFNIFLFILMLYTFPSVYRGRVYRNRKYNESLNYSFIGLLLILYCTFGYVDNDFYHYERLFESASLSGINIHFEPIYFWIIENITSDYLTWRLLVWGSAVVILLWTFRRLKLDIRTSICFLTIYYVLTLSVMRGNLGISILFWGFTFIIKPLRNRFFSYCLGLSLIASSFYFHRSMFVAICFILVTPFKLNKRIVILSLIFFPVLVYVTNNLLAYINTGIYTDLGAEMQIGAKMTGYIGGESSTANINGIIAKIVTYLPIVVALVYITRKVTFQDVVLPRLIYVFYTYWYMVTYTAFLFLFQEASNWIFIRFLMFAYFPMVVVLSYYYYHNKRTIFMKTIMLLALLACFYRLSYAFYWRLKFEQLI